MDSKLEIEDYKIEEIPNDNKLFYRIHKVNIDDSVTDEKKKIRPVAFDPQPKGATEMSVDWCEYSTAEISKNRAKIPEKNGVVSFNSTLVRANPFPLQVKHAPTLNEHFKNQSHSVIFDVPLRQNDIGIRIKLRDICVWEILV